jgi:hypothetical protein
LIELGVVTPEKPAFRGRKLSGVEVVFQIGEIREGVRPLIVADEAVELGVTFLLAVEGAYQPGPATVRIAGGLQPGLKGRDLGLLVVGGETARVSSEVIYRR